MERRSICLLFTSNDHEHSLSQHHQSSPSSAFNTIYLTLITLPYMNRICIPLSPSILAHHPLHHYTSLLFTFPLPIMSHHLSFLFHYFPIICHRYHQPSSLIRHHWSLGLTPITSSPPSTIYHHLSPSKHRGKKSVSLCQSVICFERSIKEIDSIDTVLSNLSADDV